MMKRRQMIQALAIAPVVAALPAEAQEVQDAMSVRCARLPGPMRVKLTVYPNERKFGPGMQDRVEGWEEIYGEDFRPTGDAIFDFLEADGSPWLMHPEWSPPSKDNPAVVFTQAAMFFIGRRWDLIDRAVDTRENAYWRAKLAPKPGLAELASITWNTDYLALPGELSRAYLKWRREVRSKLAWVVVRFDAEVRA